MPSLIFSLPDLYASYQRWVSDNPLKASDLEMATKWISYYISGRINNSHMVSELVYCLSNLLVLFNDRIIATSQKLELSTSGDRLKLWLTVLEYCEVFLELSAQKLWGTYGKWLIVVVVQVFKSISRLSLVYHHKENIIQHPPIPILQRINMSEPVHENGVAYIAQKQLDSVSFSLKRSGKVLRKVEASPPVSGRTWKPVERFDNEQTIEQALAGQQLIAETIYIIKPIAHLAAVACFGNNKWKPWIISLVLDLGSLHLYQSSQKKNIKSLTKKQNLQISRRYAGLLLYLLRSPFYEKYSKNRIEGFLATVSNKVPFAELVCTPISKYLPYWQNNYFYTWST